MTVIGNTGLVLATGLIMAGTAAGAAAQPGGDMATRTCFGERVTVMGTPGDDVLRGEADVREVFHGGAGDDTIVGGEFYDDSTKADLICGGPGNDYLKGARGDDKIRGGPGSDRVNGSNGDDVELGGAGDDLVGESSFADADRGDDLTRGGPGDDTLMAAWGNDRLYGGRGNDELSDSECSATFLSGGRGNDDIISWSSSFQGWSGNICAQAPDTVKGGRGRDTAEVDALDAVSGVEDLTRLTELP